MYHGRNDEDPEGKEEIMTKLAIVVPCYNEQEVLPDTNRQLTELMNGLMENGKVSGDSFILYVNDGSRDDTWSLIDKYAHEYKNVQGLKLAGNVGHQNALLAGLRVGEVCKLAPSDIYMSKMQIHVRGTKNHGDHWTILSERALELLKAYWYSYPVNRDILFVSLRRPHNPLKPGGVESMLKKISKEACVVAHPHTLRHSFATHLIEDDTRREYVQAMLGHKSPASTAVYVHVSNMSLMGVKSPLDKPKNSKCKNGNRKKKSGGKKDE